MLSSFVFPILSGLLSAAVCAVSARFRPPHTGGHSEFRFSAARRIFIWTFASAGIVGLSAVMSAPPAATAPSLLLAGVLAIYGFSTCVWTDRVTLEFFDDHLTYGAFRTFRFNYKDIISAEMKYAGRGSPYLFIKTSEKTLSISGYLTSLDDAARLLNSKLISMQKILPYG